MEPTGIGWTAIPLPTGRASAEQEDVADLAAGAGTWLAVAAGEAGSWTWTSADGRHWERHEVAEWAGFEVGRAAWWGDRFIVGGAVGTGPDAHVAFWTSADGFVWQRVPDSPVFALVQGDRVTKYVGGSQVAGGNVNELYVDGDRLVVEGTVSVFCECDSPPPVERWTTSDLVDWHWRIAGTDDRMRRPVQTAVGWFRTDGYYVERSLDGTDWQRAFLPEPAPGAETEIWQLAAYGEGVVAVGRLSHYDQTPPFVQFGWSAVSEDGTKWQESTGWPDLARGYMIGVASDGAQLVGYGRGGATPADYDEFGNPQLPYVWLSPP